LGEQKTDLPVAAIRYRTKRITQWRQYRRGRASRGYYARLTQIYQSLIPIGKRVLELGCGRGDLLAAVQPRFGVGLDFSEPRVQEAARAHPELHFPVSDVHAPALRGRFDYVILSDLVDDLWDVHKTVQELHHLCVRETRVLINTYSRVWELPLALVRRLGLANRVLEQNWLTPDDLTNLLHLSGFEVVSARHEILLPLSIPFLARLCNQFLVKLFPLNLLALTNIIVARPRPGSIPHVRNEPLVSVIIPARNEAGNIEAIFRRMPEMGAGTEMVFVEGHSLDDTLGTIQRSMARHPERQCKLIRQSGVGKGDAVRAGFSAATGDVLMILDADLTVQPEDLPRCFDALWSGKGELINGVRLVYPMEREAMRFLNFLGNKFFGLTFSWLIGQRIKDTLCGTKVVSRAQYELIAQNRSYFGDFDPFGDFDLLFGAARLNMKIVDVPLRYQARTYGTTNIARWRHGWLLVRMVIFGSLRIKFT
jgi:SAM-dependent methyltransferase